MTTIQILKEIEKLPLNKRILIAERTLKSIRENDSKSMMKVAADALLDNYINDPALNEFYY